MQKGKKYQPIGQFPALEFPFKREGGGSWSCNTGRENGIEKKTWSPIETGSGRKSNELLRRGRGKGRSFL